VADIRQAKKDGKTAVLLSWQNTAGIEDQLDYLRVFRDLGVKKMQLTYNTQNYSGAGYTEIKDSGLTGFGQEVVTEMAKLGEPSSRFFVVRLLTRTQEWWLTSVTWVQTQVAMSLSLLPRVSKHFSL
jgi:hypothetical protein